MPAAGCRAARHELDVRSDWCCAETLTHERDITDKLKQSCELGLNVYAILVLPLPLHLPPLLPTQLLTALSNSEGGTGPLL